MSMDFDTRALRLWEAHGLKCAVLPAPIYGAINGYVQVPPTHPDFDKDYDDVGVDVHGGLTYSDAEGWYGFDTLHSGDYWPDMATQRFLPQTRAPGDRTWTQQQVEQEVEFLAEQLAERGAS